VGDGLGEILGGIAYLVNGLAIFSIGMSMVLGRIQQEFSV
jgi:hypothetical protein